MWFVALQPGQEQPCDCFDHADNIVHMDKTIAQKGAHVVKDGIRHKDVYATAVGDITKAYLLCWEGFGSEPERNQLFYKTTKIY